MVSLKRNVKVQMTKFKSISNEKVQIPDILPFHYSDHRISVCGFFRHLNFLWHLGFGRQVPRPAKAGSRGTIKTMFPSREVPAFGQGASHLSFMPLRGIFSG
jgi:hypothetical protein